MGRSAGCYLFELGYGRRSVSCGQVFELVAE